MSQLQTQADVINIVIQIAFWTAVIFPFALLTFWDWRKGLFGKSLIALDSLVALALLPAIMRRYFGINTGDLAFGWFEAAIIACIPVRAFVLGYSIFRLQRRRGPSADVASRTERTERPQRDERCRHPAEPSEPAEPR